MIKGDLYSSVNYGDFIILRYNGCNDVDIRFISTGFELKTTSSSIRKGQVKDYILPKIYGVGFAGIGSLTPKENPARYDCWRDMLRRCYSKNRRKRNKCYIGVTVCDEWHNFQNFAKWYDLNYPLGNGSYQIDKDVRQKGVTDKIYSPATCVFIPALENTIEAKAKHYLFINPQGETVKVYNLAQFAKDNDLTRRSMGKVHSGERTHHKGWTRA